MRKGINVGIILALIAAFLLLGGGLLRDISEEVDVGEGKDMVRKIKDFVGEFSSPTVSVSREMSVEGEITHNDAIDFEAISPEKLIVEYSPEDMNVTAGSKNIKIDEEVANITLEGFRGSASVSPDEISLQGEAQSLKSGAATIGGGLSEVSVDGKYVKAILKSVELEKIKFQCSSGSLVVDGSITISPEGKTTELGGFLGDVEFSGGNLKVNGDVSRVSTNNKTLSTSSLA